MTSTIDISYNLLWLPLFYSAAGWYVITHYQRAKEISNPSKFIMAKLGIIQRELISCNIS